jgi:GYF domain 2
MNDSSTGPENWFYVREGRRQGPFSRALLVRELLALDVPEAVLVWRKGLAAWTKAGLLDDLRRELPPPVPGVLPLPLQERELPVPELPEEYFPRAVAPGEAQTAGEGYGSVADGDRAAEAGEAPSSTDDSSPGGRRRRRRRSAGKHKRSGLPSYVLPLALLFIAVILALWFLLRRMNEVPAGRIIQQGEVNDSRSGATPA